MYIYIYFVYLILLFPFVNAGSCLCGIFSQAEHLGIKHLFNFLLVNTQNIW